MAEGQAVRAFVAIELSAPVRALLATVQQELREGLEEAAHAVRWVAPQSVHLTLQFLGDVPSGQVDSIKHALGQAVVGVPQFELTLGGLGVFPNMRRIRVIWVGLEGDQKAREALRTLQAQVAEQLAPLGYTPDKSFKPHLTLGRVRDTVTREEMAQIAEVMTYPQEQPVFETSLIVNEVSLMKSDLQPGGSVYSRLAHLSLARDI